MNIERGLVSMTRCFIPVLLLVSFVALGCNGGTDDNGEGETSDVVGNEGGEDAQPPTDTDNPNPGDGIVADTDESDVIGEVLPEPNMEMCTLDSLVGIWELANWETDAYSAVTGSVANGVNPQTILLPEETEGNCVLLRKENPFCDPGCEPNEACTHEGTCIPYPLNQSVGQVLISGLLTETNPFDLKMDVTNSYWDTLVPFPLFEVGSQISLEAAGETIEGFSLVGVGVEQLVIEDRYWTMEDGLDMPITWTPEEGPWEIYITINVDQHGNSPVTMFCRAEDTGSFTVPGELISILLDYGVSGFATANVFRRTIDSIMIAEGCVELRVFSHIRGMLQVAGHTACFTDLDCPEGQKCEMLIQTCVDI